MNNGGGSDLHRGKLEMVKMELEDSLEEEHGPLHKRPKNFTMGGLTMPPSQYNPLDEPSPIGLRLRKSPSLLELIQMKLSQSTSPKALHSRKHASKASVDKLKASNFLGSLLRIGAWEYKSRHEGDLVAKCYFAKHKLVWEVLDGGLKNKIEIQWSDIMDLKANYDDDGPGTLHVVLARQPVFFRETNPQPRKHILWQATSDFTGGQASMHRKHYLECPQGILGKHFEKLTQCDPRLNFLSQQGEITLDSPYFEPKISVFDDQSESRDTLDLNTEGSPSVFSLSDVASPPGVRSSPLKNDIDATCGHTGSYPRETPSPVSAMDTPTKDIRHSRDMEKLNEPGKIRVPGLSSMSMTDLVSHLETRISRQPENPTLSGDDWQSLHILDEIKRCLFSDSQNLPISNDDKSLMSRVNSLCCLLQKDNNNENEALVEEVGPLSMRKDSVGELLLNLPRIASLPLFFS